MSEDAKSLKDADDEEILKDIQDFIVNNLISTSEESAYSLAILYNSLKEDDQKELRNGILRMSKKINDMFGDSVAEKEGTSVEFMFALLYMLASMSGTLMSDAHWERLTNLGKECRERYLQTRGVLRKDKYKPEELIGYG